MDISLCQNASCPCREQCFRFKAAPNPFTQAYGEFSPLVDGKCIYFIPLEKT